MVGVVILIILVGVIIGLLVCYRVHRRVKRLKTELAHVHYIADPGMQPGKGAITVQWTSTSFSLETSSWASSCLNLYQKLP